MKKDQLGLFHSTKTEQQFIFYRTDDIAPSERSQSGLENLAEDLQTAIPGLLIGRLFLDQIYKYLKPLARFGAMVVKIDPENNEKDTLPEKQIIVAKAIESIAKKEPCLWGQMEERLFACLFPEKDADACLKTAKAFQKSVSKPENTTVSIGIAVYPTISFEKDRIVENARKAIDHASFFGPNSTVVFDSVSLNISGDHFYQLNDIQKAVSEFLLALEMDPQNVNVHNSLGVCYGIMGDFEKAAAHFETAMSLDPNEEMAWYNAGLISKLKKENENALNFFLKAGALNGERFEVAYQTGKTYLDMGRPEKGRPFLKKAVTLKPESGPYLRFLGECYLELDMKQEAIATYKKAVKENPHDAASLSALGYLFDEQGENPEISELFCQQSVDISPENGLFRLRLGRIFMKQEKHRDAMAEFKKALELGADASEDMKTLEGLINSLP